MARKLNYARIIIQICFLSFTTVKIKVNLDCFRFQTDQTQYGFMNLLKKCSYSFFLVVVVRVKKKENAQMNYMCIIIHTGYGHVIFNLPQVESYYLKCS